MKALLFSLKTCSNLHALKVAADHIETVFKGNVPGTIGDLARLTKLPHSLRERLEDIPLHVDKGLLPELTSFIVSELCMSVFVLEELMWEYRTPITKYIHPLRPDLSLIRKHVPRHRILASEH